MGITLRARLGYGIGMLLAVSLAIAAIGVSGAGRVHQDFGIAMRGLEQLREVYEIGFHASHAQKLLGAGNVEGARQQIEAALTRLELYSGADPLGAGQTDLFQGDLTVRVHELRNDLRRAQVEIANGAATTSLDEAIARIAKVAAEVRTLIAQRQQAAAAARMQTGWTIAAASGWLILSAAVMGLRQYRNIIRPLDELGTAVRQFATGDLDVRVQTSGDREFVQLGTDFNYMAGELAVLQRDLEEKVAAKSRELVRSERLASVGYLAAGVAHEINNPLGIIAAYAERATQQMRRCDPTDPAILSGIKALEVIHEEAFRCKGITDRLLTLARPGTAERKPASIGALAQEVLSTLGGLPQWRTMDLTLECESNENLMALVNDGEIKQVILNLLVNALESVPERSGLVRTTVTRQGRYVRLCVDDNGRGIERQSLDRVFEPFFTRKRFSGTGRVGTGLGLSVCQAIVDGHGGRIFAESEGEGRGSRFTVLIPALSNESVKSPAEVQHG